MQPLRWNGSAITSCSKRSRAAAAGKDKLLGTPDDVAVQLVTPLYDAAVRQVRLAPSAVLKQKQALQLTVNGTTGVVDESGTRLNGDGDAIPGGDYVAIIGSKFAYLDHDRDKVSLALAKGGLMRLTRRPDGEGQALQVGLLGSVTSKTALSGKVTAPKSGGSDRCTAIQSVTGLGPGQRKAPACTAAKPGFEFGTISAAVVDELLAAAQVSDPLPLKDAARV
jgi:hypothetical protein